MSNTEPVPCCDKATTFTGLCSVHTPYQQGVLEGERRERERIVKWLCEMKNHTYPTDVWPEPEHPRCLDNDAAALLRRFGKLWGDRIERGEHE